MSWVRLDGGFIGWLGWLAWDLLWRWLFVVFACCGAGYCAIHSNKNVKRPLGTGNRGGSRIKYARHEIRGGNRVIGDILDTIDILPRPGQNLSSCSRNASYTRRTHAIIACRALHC